MKRPQVFNLKKIYFDQVINILLKQEHINVTTVLKYQTKEEKENEDYEREDKEDSDSDEEDTIFEGISKWIFDFENLVKLMMNLFPFSTDYMTPIDKEDCEIDEYIIFNQVLEEAQRTNPEWYSVLTATLTGGQQKALDDVIVLASERSKAKGLKKP